jgi:redox-regulated HSP33 family molecular chaperone
LNRDDQVTGAGEILVQIMGSDFYIAEILQTNDIRLLQLGSISRLVSLACDATSIFERISGAFQHEILDRQPISLKCTCNREKNASQIIHHRT